MVNAVPVRSEAATATIASGASLSAAVDMQGRALTGILLPAAWTAAGVTFSVSHDGITYGDLYGESGEYSLTVGASSFVGLNPGALMGFRFIKVRSGTAAAAVNQAAQRDVILMLGDFTR